MALVTNIVAADEDEFIAVGESMRPMDEWSVIDGLGLDTAKVTMLHCLLTGDEYGVALALHEPVYVAESGVIVLALAGSVVDRLAALDDEVLAQLAEELAATEDFEIDEWSAEHVLALLVELAGLARLAESQGQALFVWMHPGDA
ncbi:MAG: hypothetical protein WAZ34_00405 [Rhodocyclaceae bacterium]